MSNLINRFVAITALNEAQIEFNAHYWGLGEAKEIIDSLPTVNAVVIPDNATNGDMIKALFPNGIQINDTPIISYSFGEYRFRFSDEWWNAPYKKGENNE